MGGTRFGNEEATGSSGIPRSLGPLRCLVNSEWTFRLGPCGVPSNRRVWSEVAMKYLVVVERGEDAWGAHVPDLPGCIAAGKTREEALRLIREAIVFHVEGLRDAGETIPTPSSEAEVVDVDAA